MRKNYYNKGKHFISSVIITAFVLVVSIGINTGEMLGLADWKDVFNRFGVSDISTSNCDDGISVHVIDVGKADSIYINCGETNILIDAGDVDTNNTVVNYLKKAGVQKLDLVVVSHPHRDHIGQMKSVIKEFQIDKFMMARLPNELTPTGKTYENMLLELRSKKMKITQPKAGEELKFGDLRLKVLSPSYKVASDNINEYSIVLQAIYGSRRFLFMGDAGKPVEQELLYEGYNLHSDMLKVGHHGSRSASTKEFLEAVSPKYAILSVGENKSNLPKEEVIKRLKAYCKSILRTDDDGTVVILSDGKRVWSKTEKGS